MKRISLHTKRIRLDEVDVTEGYEGGILVDLPDDAVVTSVTYIDPFAVIQYWRPASAMDLAIRDA